MGEILYTFIDLDTTGSFAQLGERFGARMVNDGLHFDNENVSGVIYRSSPEPGLWIRKWKLTVLEKITLRKMPASDGENKYYIVYFLNPSIFSLKKEHKDFTVPTNRNNLFFTGNVLMDFSVLPNQPFYVLDIGFSAQWLQQQLSGTDEKSGAQSEHFISQYSTNMSLLPCSVDEYMVLRELEMLGEDSGEKNILFTRSRVYKLISEFLRKLLNPETFERLPGMVHYEQVMQAEKMVRSDLKKMAPVESIAASVSLSPSTLIRHFKNLFGKGIEEYYIEWKMEIARKLIAQQQHSIKDVSEAIGYKQVSAFIETFTKVHGYSPGTLKQQPGSKIA